MLAFLNLIFLQAPNIKKVVPLLDILSNYVDHLTQMDLYVKTFWVNWFVLLRINLKLLWSSVALKPYFHLFTKFLCFENICSIINYVEVPYLYCRWWICWILPTRLNFEIVLTDIEVFLLQHLQLPIAKDTVQLFSIHNTICVAKDKSKKLKQSTEQMNPL